MDTIESPGSSPRIERSKLSDHEIEQLLSYLQIKTVLTRDEQEVAGYVDVMELVFSFWEATALTENHINQLYQNLLVYLEETFTKGYQEASISWGLRCRSRGRRLHDYPYLLRESP